MLDRLERIVARYRWALSRLEDGEDPDAIADEWTRLVSVFHDDIREAAFVYRALAIELTAL